jgi:histidinol-phosphate/aromatic aminotransferase/cobyric acid decarboxylase-like protein
MVLAISSYQGLRGLADRQDLLNLAWMIDERPYLAADLPEIIKRELAAEIREELPYLNNYSIQDGYGEQALNSPVAGFFGQDDWQCRVTCAAGVNSLLYALAHLSADGPAYVIGDVYPDFPHWVERFGGRCLSRFSPSMKAHHIDNIRAVGAAVVLLERPAGAGNQLSLHELGEFCDAVRDTVVVVDESYANYCSPGFSAVKIAAAVPNLVVLRGLSKAYWLGGLRFGYCVTSSALTERLRAFLPPLLASSLSIRLAKAILELGDIAQPLRTRIRSAKAEMVEILGTAAPDIQAKGDMPYVLCSRGETQRVLEQQGVIGKHQPFWTEACLSVTYKYRLSVPLDAERMRNLRHRLRGVVPMPARDDLWLLKSRHRKPAARMFP